MREAQVFGSEFCVSLMVVLLDVQEKVDKKKKTHRQCFRDMVISDEDAREITCCSGGLVCVCVRLVVLMKIVVKEFCFVEGKVCD